METGSYIDLKTPYKRDFSKYFLLRNPFPTVGVPEIVPLITVDREKIIDQFRSVVFEVLDSGKSILTIMVGEYGSGKSHLLKTFKQNVNSQLLSIENGTLAGYVKSPGEEFRDFVLSFIDDVGKSTLQGLSAEVIRIFCKETADVDKYFFDTDCKEKVKAGNLNLDEILVGSRYLDMISDIASTKFKTLKNDDLVKAFLGLANPEFSSLGWRWLSGDSLSKSEKERLGFTSRIESGNAFELFADLINMLKLVGIANFVILVDELEKITFLHPSRRDRYEDDLRQLIDDNPRNMILYFAIAPRQWEALTKETTALARRLSGNWYLLEEFELKDVKELVERYLFTARMENFSGKSAKEKFPDLEPSICPFSDSSLVRIQELSEGVVSRILLLCKKSLDYLHDNKDQYLYVTRELVDGVYSSS